MHMYAQYHAAYGMHIARVEGDLAAMLQLSSRLLRHA